MSNYDALRRRYQPDDIILLLIAESPPPDASVQSSRHFYRSEMARRDDRLFVNTVRALYKEAEKSSEPEIEADKEAWLQRLKRDGVYMIEALDISQEHEVTKSQRQVAIAENIPTLLAKVKRLAGAHTAIILIKSNVFDVANAPLREAGYNVLNEGLVDYPGRFNQPAYREKLRELASSHGWRM